MWVIYADGLKSHIIYNPYFNSNSGKTVKGVAYSHTTLISLSSEAQQSQAWQAFGRLPGNSRSCWLAALEAEQII